MARRLVALVLTVLAPACSWTGSRTAAPPPPPTIGPPGPPELTEAEAEPLAEALATDILEGESPSEIEAGDSLGEVEVLKAVRRGDAAFMVASTAGRPGPDEAFVSLVLRTGGWQVVDVAPIVAVPPRGSNAFLFQTLTVGLLVAHGGLVDPNASAVDALDPFGRVVDEDEPFAGAAVVVSERFGLLRVHGEGRAIGALQIAVTSADELELLRSSPVRPTRRDEARPVADGFVDTLLSEGWVEATSFYSPVGRPDLLLPPLETVVAPGSWSRDGKPEVQPRGFVYPISSAQGEGLLHIQLTRYLGEWKVTGCALSTPPEDAAEPIG
jgi:hypothetical protein